MPTEAVTGTQHLHTTTEDPLTTCSHCGQLRRGTDLVQANNRFYCHAILDDTPTCYQQVILGVDDDGQKLARTDSGARTTTDQFDA